MTLFRAGGILLHVTSLPGGHGIGDLGPEAYAWLEWLRRAGCALWQVLPLGPVGPGWSPYQSPSSFAGNPLLISLERLAEDGWLGKSFVEAVRHTEPRVDFEAVHAYKRARLLQAAEAWRQRGRPGRESFEAWRDAHRHWLDVYALFVALKEAQGGVAWQAWEPDLARRRPEAIAAAARRLADRIETVALEQYWFWSQWERLRSAARASGIRIIGDLPIYVALDSADVWSRPDLFELDGDGRPLVVAGVPPDYFSSTGQLWSNPIYRWERHRAEGYRWWIERVRHLTRQVDFVRIDHFRGLEAFWEVPADAPTAATGRWVPGPGADLLEQLRNALGGLPLVAEDLGVITPGVRQLLDRFDLPGMKVLQFGLEAGPDEDDVPARYPRGCVAYTATHDNDTSTGWFQSADETTREFARRILRSDGADIAWAMIRAVWESPADWAIAPLQDVLGLGSEARMNIPGRADGNWTWRTVPGALTDDLAGRLRDLGQASGRVVGRPD